jgi:hypothetical protein
MAGIDEYVSTHGHLSVSEPGSDSGGGSVKIEAHVTGISAQHVFFTHMGRAFAVQRRDVIDIADVPRVPTGDPANKGSNLLEIRSNARIQSQNFLKASALTEGTPFAISRPVGPGVQVKKTAAQLALREKMRSLLSDDDDDSDDSYGETWEWCGDPPVGDRCVEDIID